MIDLWLDDFWTMSLFDPLDFFLEDTFKIWALTNDPLPERAFCKTELIDSWGFLCAMLP